MLVLLPDRNEDQLEILEWVVNGVDMCPACGQKNQATGLVFSRIADGEETAAEKWPWHVSLWRRGAENLSYICGGSIVNKKWVISAGIKD